ncbi:MAG: LysM peptidoglycan-binding domain-containing protein [Verrucomicrobiales bacterium]|nr:LysM peptidoglycan-binding domain-containing protein [Verrucomicrobiales bacterium]
MNNTNPFVPKGSILELQSKRRSRLKLAVFCSLTVAVTGLAVMLIQGCKREQPVETDMTTPTIDTNLLTSADTNAPVVDTNLPVAVMPPAIVPPVETAGAEYVVVKGDTLDKIAKSNHVTVKALEAANPGVVPTKLKIGQKLVIPAGTAGTVAPAAMDSTGGVEIYVVKSGDTLTKIAKLHGTTVKAIQAENNLVTTSIKAGQKLKIPAKAAVAVPAPLVEPAPVAPAPVVPATEPAK